MTFVSTQESFVLGTAPSTGTCMIHTLDRGQTWTALPALGIPLGSAGSSSGHSVWGTRFASPSHGFVFGVGLWETTDGGGHWTLHSQPTGTILSLAVIRGQVLALKANGSVAAGFSSATLLRRALSGGSWSTVATLPSPDLADPNDLIATQGGTAAVLAGTSVIVTSDGGLTIATHATPTLTSPFVPSSVAVTSAHGLALLCVGEGAAGHTQKLVYTSADGGATWSKAGTPPFAGDGGTLAGVGNDLVLASTSAASWLYRSTNGGHSWTTPVTYGDGGLGWADLGFTSPSDAVVVHGPADSASASDGRIGKVVLSSDGGATWHSVTF